MWSKDPNTRRHYLWFADNNYLLSRQAIYSGFHVPGVAIAEQAVEQYCKLIIYTFFNISKIKKEKITNCHDPVKLFIHIEPIFVMNSWSIKRFSYYKDLLENLKRAYEFRYFDEKGVLGELKKGLTVNIGLPPEQINKLDALCCELRNASQPLSMGLIEHIVIDKEIKEETNPKVSAFYFKNNYPRNFLLQGEAYEDFIKRRWMLKLRI